MSHDHPPHPGHGHSHGHSHSHTPRNERKLAIAAILTGSFMLAEVAGGVISGSLALIADAGHMLTDFAALLLAWFALRLARRPADWRRTYGFDRFSVLAAFVNGLTLFAIAVWIVWEAVERLRAPGEILGGVMLWIALGGLVVNLVAFRILTRGEEGNLNVRAAALHVAGDLLGSVAAIVAALVILLTGWTPIDPILSVVVVLIILRSAWAVVRESGRILLEAAPPGLDSREIAKALCALPGVKDASHIHAWSVSEERPMITLEIAVMEGHDAREVKGAVKALLEHRFHIDHATVEVL